MFSHISEIEPFFTEINRKIIEEKAIDLIAASNSLGTRLNDITAKQVAGLVKTMNSYYSNLIEGNKTTPREIEMALRNELTNEPKKRENQLEHVAHISVQDKIDRDLEKNPDLNICTIEFICRIHKEFYDQMPHEYRVINRPDGTMAEVVPGGLRTEGVEVGTHIPPGYESVRDFLKRFSELYNPDRLSTIDKIIAVAASHHRLAWMHPFLDGNGRVARLFTHSYLFKAGINSRGLWSISRGFARDKKKYYEFLAKADENRKGDVDGRGKLSDRGLSEFCDYFFSSAIDQIEFMSSLFDIENITSRIKKFVDLSGDLKPEAFYILKEVFIAGEVKRGDVPKITAMPERSARRVLRTLIDKHLLVSDTPKSPVKISFPVDAVEYYFPRLFPAN